MPIFYLIIGQIIFFISEHHCPFASVLCEVTLWGFVGGGYLPLLPAEFGCCRYAVLQCCGWKDEFTLRDNGVR